jgi:hypothetical protein
MVRLGSDATYRPFYAKIINSNLQLHKSILVNFL